MMIVRMLPKWIHPLLAGDIRLGDNFLQGRVTVMIAESPAGTRTVPGVLVVPDL